MKATYITIAVFSLIPALILMLFLIPGLQPGMAMDLAWTTFLLLIFNSILSLTILFIEEKLRPNEKSKQKG